MLSIHFYSSSYELKLKFAEIILKFHSSLSLFSSSLTPFLSTANPCPVPFIIPENALLSEVDFYVGQNVSIRCREGYQLKGQAVITCNADETWTPTTAKCESKYGTAQYSKYRSLQFHTAVDSICITQECDSTNLLA